jgi:hypothetical protein
VVIAGNRSRSRPASAGTAEHTHDGDPPVLLVNPVDHPVGSPASTVAILQWWPQSFADPMRIIQQRPCDERIRRERHGL